jgi:hypothetical protein
VVVPCEVALVLQVVALATVALDRVVGAVLQVPLVLQVVALAAMVVGRLMVLVLGVRYGSDLVVPGHTGPLAAVEEPVSHRPQVLGASAVHSDVRARAAPSVDNVDPLHSRSHWQTWPETMSTRVCLRWLSVLQAGQRAKPRPPQWQCSPVSWQSASGQARCSSQNESCTMESQSTLRRGLAVADRCGRCTPGGSTD